MLLKKDSLAIKVREENHLTKYSAPCLGTTCTKCQITSPKVPSPLQLRTGMTVVYPQATFLAFVSFFAHLGPIVALKQGKALASNISKGEIAAMLGPNIYLEYNEVKWNFNYLNLLSSFLPASTVFKIFMKF